MPGCSVPPGQLSQQDNYEVPTDHDGDPVIQENNHAGPFELHGRGHQQDGNDLGDQQRRHRSGAHQACEEHAAFMGPHLHAQQSGEDIQHL